MSDSENIETTEVPQVETKVKRQGKGGGNPNLAEARLKAHEARRQQGIISRAKKAQAKAERDAEYAKALQFLNGPEKTTEGKEVKKVKKGKTKVIEITDSSSSSSESDSDSDESIDVVRVVRKPKKKPPPPPKKKPKKSKRVVSDSEDSEDSEDDTERLAGHVARDMLQKRVLQKAADEAIRRLVPNFRGFG